MDTRPISQADIADQSERAELGDSVSVADLIQSLSGFVHRQYPILVFIVACALGLGLVYLLTTPAQYTSHAMLMIDSSKMRVLQDQQQQNALGDLPLDTAQVETQVEILKSEGIGLSVIKDQRLTEDPEFVGTGGGLLGALLGLFDSPEASAPQSELDLTRKALATFLRKRTITRVGRTYVLDIGFTSSSAARAAAMANAVTDAYIVDQLEAKYQATKRASAWLEERIDDLRAQATVADRAVLDYKEKNNIVNVESNGTGERLLGDQELTEQTTQLGNARAATAEAKARLDRIQAVMKLDVPDAAVTDSLHSDVINRLRNQYLDLSAKEAIWAVRYGPNHLATVNLRTQMNEIKRSISAEVSRIAESYKSDWEIAKSRQESLEKNFAGLVTEAQVTSRDRLGLRELESNAHVYHTIYDNFLQHYMEAIQQQSFPITEARVISTAAPPSVRSSPQTLSVLAIAGSLGLILSFGLATLREAVDRVFRTTRQVEDTLRTNCLAVLPALKNGKALSMTAPSGRVGDAEPKPNVVRLGKKGISGNRDFLRQVVAEPLSSFAEAFRAIKIAADINGAIKENKVIGVTSTLPREGKSTISSNLAQLMAHAGKRVILVDGDLRHPTLTSELGSDAKVGLLEVLAGKVTLSEAIYTDEETGMAFLPAVLESRLAHTSEILASEAFKRLVDTLRATYDYVVIDFPPLAPVVDVRATTNIVDSYIFVVEWGQTRMNVVQHQLAAAPELYDRLLGVVLNKANLRVLDRYEYYHGSYYHKRYYARYGYTD